MDAASAFAEELRQHRRQRGLMQEELAEPAQLSERAGSDLERGLKKPQRATICWMVEGLALSPDQVERFEEAARSRPQLFVQRREQPRQAHLPAALTSFGREQEAAELLRQLGCARLLTVVGPGGGG